jgi:hypothetical protein
MQCAVSLSQLIFFDLYVENINQKPLMSIEVVYFKKRVTKSFDCFKIKLNIVYL